MTNNMPERISAYLNGMGLGCFEFHPNIPLTTEYIRADALRTKLGGYHDSDLLSLAESLRTFHDNAEATMERLLEQLDAANKRIAELEAAMRDIARWRQEDQDDVEIAILQWRGCVAIARGALGVTDVTP